MDDVNNAVSRICLDGGTYAKEHLHVWVALDVHTVQVDDGDFLYFVGVLVHMEVWPGTIM